MTGTVMASVAGGAPGMTLGGVIGHQQRREEAENLKRILELA